MNHLHARATANLKNEKLCESGKARRTVIHGPENRSADQTAHPGDWLWPVTICILLLLAGLEEPAAPAAGIPARGVTQADEVLICYGERNPNCQRLADTHLAARTGRLGAPLP